MQKITMNIRARLLQIVSILLIACLPLHSMAMPKPEIQIEPGIYVLVSFSMNDQSLRKYFEDAQKIGGKLILRGLVGDKAERNRFAETKRAAQRAKINFDINPNIFEYLNVKQVPTIAFVDANRTVKKISGHITLAKALEIMEVEIPRKSNNQN